ncbi:Hypothetical_protein [Hexamita inflata]|uniref:Hypothetical_protein n=1 Tax=Hexamita inflata TaxID=28002 RepID=A0AA86Q8J6_9EUKA|nr:Hypothetical protein HINF_LOCUS41901 [Hexamita inflata]
MNQRIQIEAIRQLTNQILNQIQILKLDKTLNTSDLEILSQNKNLNKFNSRIQNIQAKLMHYIDEQNIILDTQSLYDIVFKHKYQQNIYQLKFKEVLTKIQRQKEANIATALVIDEKVQKIKKLQQKAAESIKFHQHNIEREMAQKIASLKYEKQQLDALKNMPTQIMKEVYQMRDLNVHLVTELHTQSMALIALEADSSRLTELQDESKKRISYLHDQLHELNITATSLNQQKLFNAQLQRTLTEDLNFNNVVLHRIQLKFKDARETVVQEFKKLQTHLQIQDSSVEEIVFDNPSQELFLSNNKKQNIIEDLENEINEREKKNFGIIIQNARKREVIKEMKETNTKLQKQVETQDDRKAMDKITNLLTFQKQIIEQLEWKNAILGIQSQIEINTE